MAHLDACSTWTWSQFYFLNQICKQHKKIWHFCFISLSLTHHLNDSGFLPVQSPPGCLQHLNQPGAQFYSFLQKCKQHRKIWHFCFTSRSLTLQIRNLGFNLSRVHLEVCSTWTWSQFNVFHQICKQPQNTAMRIRNDFLRIRILQIWSVRIRIRILRIRGSLTIKIKSLNFSKNIYSISLISKSKILLIFKSEPKS